MITADDDLIALFTTQAQALRAAQAEASTKALKQRLGRLATQARKTAAALASEDSDSDPNTDLVIPMDSDEQRGRPVPEDLLDGAAIRAAVDQLIAQRDDPGFIQDAKTIRGCARATRPTTIANALVDTLRPVIADE